MASDPAMEKVDALAPVDDAGHEHDVKADLEEGLAGLNLHLEGYEEAEAYYTGQVDEKFLSPAMRRLLSGSKTDFKINLTGRIVTAVTERLEISSVTAEPLDTEEDGGPAPIELTTGTEAEGPEPGEELTDILTEKVWEHNEMDLEMPEIIEKASSLGDAYVYVWPDDERGRIDVFYESPMQMRLFYDEETKREKRFAIKRWCVGSKSDRRVRVNLIYADGTVKLISAPNKSGKTVEDFGPYTDDYTDDSGWMVNPGGELPVFHYRTGRPYGKPEHVQAYGAQDAFTKLVTNQMTMSDFAAFPQRYALMDPEAGAGGDDTVGWGEDETVTPSERKSQFVSGPGRVWLLNTIKQVGQFPAGDVDQLIKPMLFYMSVMAAITGTPVSYLTADKSPGINTRSSGEGQRQDKDPLFKKVQKRQKSFGATTRDWTEYALRLLGSPARVHVSWAAVQTVDDKDGWQAVQEQQKAGVPVRFTLLERGYTAEQCDEWGYTEDEPDGAEQPEVAAGTVNPFVTTPPPVPTAGQAEMPAGPGEE